MSPRAIGFASCDRMRPRTWGRGRRGWKKLHLGLDGSGTIVAHTRTDGHTDDAPTGQVLIETVDADISRVTADGAYDTVAIYEAADMRGATVVVPPTITPAVSRRRPRSSLRDRTIRTVKQIGRRQWNKESGSHRQARVEFSVASGSMHQRRGQTTCDIPDFTSRGDIVGRSAGSI